MTNRELTPVVASPSGPVQGYVEGSVLRYTGIPYATADRFEVPKPIAPWTEVFQAVEPVPACPQPPDPSAAFLAAGSLLEGLKIEERCQGLSITTPSDIKADEKLNVMVWFHGGAFVWGAADASIYYPSKLVTENRVIVVNVGSRLGTFGFLGNGTSRPANLGLLDVLESLRWVKRNISAFGGNDDARSITIFGQSAGGSTVSDMMTVEEAPCLFGRVIIQSAPLGITRGRKAMDQALFQTVANASPSLSFEEMSALTEQVIYAGKSHGTQGGMPMAPQYGFSPLPPEDKVDAMLDSRAKYMDVLIGTTAEEASMFVGYVPMVEKASHLPLVGSLCLRTFISLATAKLYTKGLKAFAPRYAKAGGKISTYTIHFGSTDPRYGAMHAAELPLLFGNEQTWAGSALLKGRSWAEVEEKGRQLRKLWADFAKGRQLQKSDSVKGVIQISSL